MNYKIAVISGDGVGPEVIKEGIKIVSKVAELDEFKVEWISYPHGAEHYIETKELISENTLKEIKASCNAVYFGTLGDPRVDPGILERGIFHAMRVYFEQYVNLRPIRLLPSIESPIADKCHNEIDFTIIRENTEDFYIGLSGRAKNGKNNNELRLIKPYRVKFAIEIDSKGSELAYQIGLLSKKGCERILKYAFEYAKSKSKSKVTVVDKANTMEIYSLWRESAEKISKNYSIDYDFNFVDLVVMQFIRSPENYQVLVAPNMFGDVLTDLGITIQGGLGLAPGANINPEGISTFHPAHGSAPMYKDKNIVNPIAAIRAAALMLEHIGQQKGAEFVNKAIESVLKEGRTRTQDLGGHNTTSEMGDAIMDKVVELHE